jgi:hypothetical protein
MPGHSFWTSFGLGEEQAHSASAAHDQPTTVEHARASTDGPELSRL